MKSKEIEMRSNQLRRAHAALAIGDSNSSRSAGDLAQTIAALTTELDQLEGTLKDVDFNEEAWVEWDKSCMTLESEMLRASQLDQLKIRGDLLKLQWRRANLSKDLKVSKIAHAELRASATALQKSSVPMPESEMHSSVLASTRRLAERSLSMAHTLAMRASVSASTVANAHPALVRVNHIGMLVGDARPSMPLCVRAVAVGERTCLALSNDAGARAVVAQCSPPLPSACARAVHVCLGGSIDDPYASLCTPTGVAVVRLPPARQVHRALGSNWPGGADTRIPAMASTQLSERTLRIAGVLDAQWHPLSSRHLCVLCRDAIRVYEVGVEAQEGGGAGMQELAAQMVDEVPLPAVDLPSEPSAFTFGASRGWEMLSLFLLCTDGSVRVLCPFLPPGVLLPAADCEALLKDAEQADVGDNCDASHAAAWVRSSFRPLSDAQFKVYTPAHAQRGMRTRPALQAPEAVLPKLAPAVSGSLACDLVVLPAYASTVLPSLLVLFSDGSLVGMLGSAPVRAAFQRTEEDHAYADRSDGGSAWPCTLHLISAVHVAHVGSSHEAARSHAHAGRATYAGGGGSGNEDAAQVAGNGASLVILQVPRLAAHWGVPTTVPATTMLRPSNLCVAVVGRHAACDVGLAWAVPLQALADALHQRSASASSSLTVAAQAICESGVRLFELAGAVADESRSGRGTVEDIVGLAVPAPMQGGMGAAPTYAYLWTNDSRLAPRVSAVGMVRGLCASIPLPAPPAMLSLPVLTTAISALSLAATGLSSEENLRLRDLTATQPLDELLRLTLPDSGSSSSGPRGAVTSDASRLHFDEGVLGLLAAYSESEVEVCFSLTVSAIDAFTADAEVLGRDLAAIRSAGTAVIGRRVQLAAACPTMQKLALHVQKTLTALDSENTARLERARRIEARAGNLKARSMAISLALQLRAPVISKEEADAHSAIASLVAQAEQQRLVSQRLSRALAALEEAIRKHQGTAQAAFGIAGQDHNDDAQRSVAVADVREEILDHLEHARVQRAFATVQLRALQARLLEAVQSGHAGACDLAVSAILDS